MSHDTKELIVQVAKITKENVKATIVAKSDIHERLTKKSRTDKSPLPEWAQGLVTLTRSVVRLNKSYEETINSHLSATGFVDSFKAAPSTVSQTIKDFPNEILREGVNSDKLYIRVFLEEDNDLEVIYLNGKGENVTSLVTTDFRDNFFPLKYGSEKQARHGVSEEVRLRDYKAENIVYLEQGKTALFNDLTKEQMELLDLEEV